MNQDNKGQPQQGSQTDKPVQQPGQKPGQTQQAGQKPTQDANKS